MYKFLVAVAFLTLVVFSSTWCLAQSREDEDILILRDGRIVRGKILESEQGRLIRILTTAGKELLFFWPEIEKVTRSPKGVSDSALVAYRRVALNEPTAGDGHVLTIFGTISQPFGVFAHPVVEGAIPVGTGYGVGLEAGIRLSRGVRWLNSGFVYSCGTEKPVSFSSVDGEPFGKELFLLTGLELETKANETVRLRGVVQVGVMWLEMPEYVFHTRPSPPFNTYTLNSASTTGFAFCVGTGVGVGRFSITGRLFAANEAYTERVDGEEWHSINQLAPLVILAVGVDVF